MVSGQMGMWGDEPTRPRWLCAYPECTEPRRRVQGAKYCENHATSVDYRTPGGADLRPNVIGRKRPYYGPAVPDECAVCGAAIRAKPAEVVLCPTCKDRVGRYRQVWREHHVPRDTQVAWMRDPRCWVCAQTVDLSGRTGRSRTAVVDHDHRCCESAYSCGKCVRGLAHARCNAKVGHIERLIQADYEQFLVVLSVLLTPSEGDTEWSA